MQGGERGRGAASAAVHVPVCVIVPHVRVVHRLHQHVIVCCRLCIFEQIASTSHRDCIRILAGHVLRHRILPRLAVAYALADPDLPLACAHASTSPADRPSDDQATSVLREGSSPHHAGRVDGVLQALVVAALEGQVRKRAVQPPRLRSKVTNLFIQWKSS